MNTEGDEKGLRCMDTLKIDDDMLQVLPELDDDDYDKRYVLYIHFVIICRFILNA